VRIFPTLVRADLLTLVRADLLTLVRADLLTLFVRTS
jgi:hypothetical protein